MELPSANRHPGNANKVYSRGRNQRPASNNPQLFEDTSIPQQQFYGGYPSPGADYAGSYGQTNDFNSAGPAYPNAGNQYGGPPQSGGMAFPGQQLLNDPMANMAVHYGQALADQGTEYVHKNIGKYVSSSKLKYYFAVDTSYVGKKLGLLVFPFAHTDWSLRYNKEEPVAPRYDVNAPDLYIPVMAFVTYILLAGVVLGTQSRFSPEHLGLTASTAIVWMIIELVVLLFTMYVLNVSTDLKYLDLLAYCGYKYVGMIVVLLGGLAFQSTGYYVTLLWMTLSIAFFLVRSLKLAIMPHSDPASFERGNKRRLYILLLIAVIQPLLMWWLTRHLAASTP
jgi:hypothetical protein